MATMITVKILETELQAPLLNPEVAKRYEEGVNAVGERASKAEGKINAETIREQCQSVIDFIDEIFGEGSAKAVFGEETDLIECLTAFWDLVHLYRDQVVPQMNEAFGKLEEKRKKKLGDI